jgi:sec-independent protein translocase protein TatA
MPQLGPLEIAVIFVVALLVFGPQRLPEIGRQVAKGMRELRSFQHSMREQFGDAFSVDDTDDEDDEAVDGAVRPPASTGPDATAAPGDEPTAGPSS